MKKISVLIIILTLLSCTTSENYELISGEWKCTSWINEAKAMDKCKNNVYFKFQTDKSYFSKLGNKEDSGDYKILDDMLYITPSGKMEFAVKIIKLNNDTLELLMNQAGDKEILTLIKEN